MADAYSKPIGWDEDVPIRSSDWEPDTGTETLNGVYMFLRDENLRTVNGISNIAATGFISTPSAAPHAWFNFGPSRLGLSNATIDYELEFKAVDTSGAGDAFIGALAVFRAREVQAFEAIRRAMAVAALTVTRPGTQSSYPTKREAETFLHRHGFH